MNDLVFPAPPSPVVPVAGGGAFPVRRIFCVGRNFAAHAREMGSDPSREPPFFFTKPADAIVTGGGDTPYPSQTSDLQHEIELVVAIGRGGTDIDVETALDHVFGYAVGLDMTRRDMQAAAKANARPWDMSKGFDGSAPIGDITPVERIGHPWSGAIELRVNGALRQGSDLDNMIWSVAEIVAYLSRLVRIAPGDLIYAGTPEGVAAVVPGDLLEAHIDGVGTLTSRIAPAPPAA